jgi:hypothetical protein
MKNEECEECEECEEKNAASGNPGAALFLWAAIWQSAYLIFGMVGLKLV